MMTRRTTEAGEAARAGPETVVAVRDGQCIVAGAPDAVITPPVLEEIYGVPFAVLSAEGSRVAQVRFAAQ